MRIAYIAPYQGPALVKRRPIVRNLSLAARVKIELIAELLQRSSHSVEILSQGEVIDHQFNFYPGYCEPDRFHPAIPIHYASALPVRFVNGAWSSLRMLRLFRRLHRSKPFDLVVIYDLKLPQVTCANYAMRSLGLPVILEYEDDAFTDRWGKGDTSFSAGWQLTAARKLLSSVSAGFGCSPFLMAQMPASTPTLVLRGVVSNHIANLNGRARSSRKNWVVFSGTLEGSQGEKQMLRAWQTLELPDWELHIAGQGPIKQELEQMAGGNRRIVFHGLLNKEENANLLCMAKIGMNPQDVSVIPGNTFPFKIIEYLAAGIHVISTPRGALEPELDAGVSYITDNSPEMIAASLKRVIDERVYECIADQAALKTYGPIAVTESLNKLIGQVMAGATM